MTGLSWSIQISNAPRPDTNIFDASTHGLLDFRQPGRLETFRLMYVAAELGAHLVRHRIGIEPLRWLTTPKALFQGRAAIDACRHPEGFRRAVALLGLELELDALPERVEGIPTTEFLRLDLDLGLTTKDRRANLGPEREFQPALYTWTIAADRAQTQIQIFGAMIAHGPAEVRKRIRERLGQALEDEAVVRLGFDWSEPLACAMVSDAVADVLMLAEEDPGDSFAEGLDIQMEQRFAS